MMKNNLGGQLHELLLLLMLQSGVYGAFGASVASREHVML